jgi:hypothetical protein
MTLDEFGSDIGVIGKGLVVSFSSSVEVTILSLYASWASISSSTSLGL